MLKKHKSKRQQPVIKNPDRQCELCGNDYKAVAPMQKTCSLKCRKKLWDENDKTFRGRNPEAMAGYNKTRVEKDPDVWARKTRAERVEIITKLGGCCIVPQCNATNPNWLHIDYIPTMQGTGFRHPRHKKWVLEHINDFRILCANHHYELTITGSIEGSDIKQPKLKVKNQF